MSKLANQLQNRTFLFPVMGPPMLSVGYATSMPRNVLRYNYCLNYRSREASDVGLCPGCVESVHLTSSQASRTIVKRTLISASEVCVLIKHIVQDIKAENFESREFFHKAQASIHRGNFKRAASLLKEALKIAPSNPNYMSHMGLCMGMMGNMRDGEIMCRKAVTLEPLKPILLVNLGRVLLEQGNREEARKAFKRAYEIDDTHAAAALELSRMGVRRKPVIRFLHRNHPLNVFLGKVRHSILARTKEPKWKKL